MLRPRAIAIEQPRVGEGKLIAAPPAAASSDFHPLSILVVDDDTLVRAATVEMLADAGHLVTDAMSGVAALHLLERDDSIDLLVTDYRMPGMAGPALIEQVRGRWPRLPILLVTGLTDAGGINHWGVRLLGKPFRQSALLAAVDQVMSQPFGDD